MTWDHHSDEVIAEKILAPFVKTYGSKIRAVANNPKKKREEDESAHFIDWQTILREAKDIFKYNDNAASYTSVQGLSLVQLP